MPRLNLEPLWLSSIRTKMYLLAWEGWAVRTEDKASKENHRASENPDSKGGQCKSFTAHCTADTLQTPLAEAVPVKTKQNHMQTTQLLSWVFLLTSWLCVILHTTDLKYQNYSSVYSASVVATCFSWPASYVWYCIQLIVSIKIILQFTQHILLVIFLNQLAMCDTA